MSVITIRPNVNYTLGTFVPTGAASNLAAISDNSDSSYVRKASGAAWAQSVVGMATPTIPAGEFVERIVPYMRYKGTSYKSHGMAVYLIAEGIPTGLPSFTAASSLIANHPGGYTVRSWYAQNLGTLRMVHATAELATETSRAFIYEFYCEVLTQKIPTLTLSNRTEASSVYAELPVTVDVAIDDWQLATSPWERIRTVTIEVQVESGGTGYGTGTVVATQQFDLNYDATGTYDETLALSAPLPNGTYKVYMRALRHRLIESASYGSEPPSPDQYGGWGTATLTMQAPLPNAPTLAVTADDAASRVAVTVTPTATTGYTAPTITVERSDDDGATWKAVRGMAGVVGAFGVAKDMGHDYEAIPGVATKYRAQIAATYSGAVLNAGTYSTVQTATVAVSTSWRLKCPELPALNMTDLRHIGDVPENVTEDSGVFRPLGRRYPVVVAGTLSGYDGQLEIRTSGASEWASLKALIEAQRVLLIESPYGGRKYLRISGQVSVTTAGPASVARRTVTAPYVEVGAP